MRVEVLVDDKQFDAGVYVFQLGPGNAIQGWHDGIALFNKGGKGILYVPGTLAYGTARDQLDRVRHLFLT